MHSFHTLLALALSALAPASARGCEVESTQFFGPFSTQSCVLPYWASIQVDHARMRKGPSLDFPVLWEYRRRDLPVKIIARHENWRKVVDPEGTTGWMAAYLLSRTRSAIVIGGIRPLRKAPNARSALAYHVEASVVGRISDCTKRWCRFDVEGQRGWIETAHIWGD